LIILNLDSHGYKVKLNTEVKSSEDEAMPRANRNFLPGYLYHITHRCHNRSFLLESEWTRQRYLEWLVEAQSRFKLAILNYTVTMNHIHLILSSGSPSENIAKGMQLAAGQTAREFNQNQDRTGAFWEDRYHATAIDSENYLLNCMIYIDLNMIRAGVINNPMEWPYGGFREIMGGRVDYPLIAMEAVMRNLHISDVSSLQNIYSQVLQQQLRRISLREAFWTESLAVGSEAYVKGYQGKLGSRGRRREIIGEAEVSVLRDSKGVYQTWMPAEMMVLSGQNDIFFDESHSLNPV